MVKISWTHQAISDLEAICLYIARDSPRYADLFADRVFDATDRLSNFPQSGRVVPEVGKVEVREIIVGKYRVVYRTLPNEVEILTVHHGARPLDPRSLTEAGESP